MTAGLINYWPVKNGTMIDVVGGLSATAIVPNFAADRYGNVNGSARLAHSDHTWNLLDGVYFQPGFDFTVTAWVLNVGCNIANAVCMNISIFLR